MRQASAIMRPALVNLWPIAAVLVLPGIILPLSPVLGGVLKPAILMGVLTLAGIQVSANPLNRLPMLISGAAVLPTAYALGAGHVHEILRVWSETGTVISFGRMLLGSVSLIYFLSAMLTALAFIAGISSVRRSIPGISSSFRAVFSGGLKTRRVESEFANANWMSEKDKRALSADGGLALGQYFEPAGAVAQRENASLRLSEFDSSPLVSMKIEAHGLVVAPPRSGKGLLLAYNLLAPNARSWESSSVIIDIKAESYFICARRRRELGRRVMLLDPMGVVAAKAKERKDLNIRAYKSARFNPLDFVRGGDLRTTDTVVILDALLPLPADKASDNEKYFAEGGRSILAGFIHYALTLPPARRTLGTIYDLVNPNAEDFKATLAAMQAVGGSAATAANRILAAGDDEKSGLMGTVRNAVGFLEHPQFRRHLAASDFDIAGLLHDDLDVFLVVPTEHVETFRNWLRLWVSMTCAMLSRGTPKKRILLFLDEMPAVGRLPPIINAFRVSSGMGLSVIGFTQTVHDMIAVYGPETWDAMKSMVDFLLILECPPADTKLSEDISKLLGKATFSQEGESEGLSLQGGRNAVNASANRNRSLVEKPLRTPEQIRKMRKFEAFALTRATDVDRNPIHLWMMRYFERPECVGLYDENPYRAVQDEDEDGD